ncbi:hypothetical protein ILUMI_25907 [Ignelater luminosus]|uniref:Uncharacterized protein n=1 Tax=Ignelater luminosus TaxID=2038154 RepID=A0A8K0FZL5_IGNLU|nr:hypothetical protein ILUMI_25907 [Ignelater luminosus]
MSSRGKKLVQMAYENVAKRVEHKFLKSDHFYIEVDSMHSAIGNKKRHIPVYSLQDWWIIFRLARSVKKCRNITEMKLSDFKDMTDIATLRIVKNELEDDIKGKLGEYQAGFTAGSHKGGKETDSEIQDCKRSPAGKLYIIDSLQDLPRKDTKAVGKKPKNGVPNKSRSLIYTEFCRRSGHDCTG